MELPDLNARWAETERPYAVGEGESYHWHCPKCSKSGQVDMPLPGAMSEAIVHKKNCSAVG